MNKDYTNEDVINKCDDIIRRMNETMFSKLKRYVYGNTYPAETFEIDNGEYQHGNI